MKKSFLLFATGVSVLASNHSSAQAPVDGCQTKHGFVPFSVGHQEGAHFVAYAKLTGDASVKYDDVYNQTTLSFIVDNEVVASSTGLMSPVQLTVNYSGQSISCLVDR